MDETRSRHIARAMDQSLARSAVCRGLKLGLQRPTAESLPAWLSPEGKQVLVGAARILEDGRSGPLSEAMQAVCDLDALNELGLGGLGRRYEALLGHTLRGRVCPFETEYGGSRLFQQAHELADLSGFYLAFGLKPSVRRGERFDHIACELEFMEFLYQKEAYSLEHKQGEMLEVTRKATRKFLRDHLARFGRAFGTHLKGEDGDSFYGKLGTALVAFLTLECGRLDVPLGPEVLELRSIDDDNVPMACGSNDDLVQIDS